MKYSPFESEVKIAIGREGPAVVTTVSDHGAGIPAEELDKLFTYFSKISVRPTSGKKAPALA